MLFRFILVCNAILFLQIASQAQLPTFDSNAQPSAPNYSDQKYWSALPFRKDACDIVLKNENWKSDSLKEVDVFYIYPTIYQKGETWNADVNDKKLNKKIDNKPVKYQASVFAKTCRVYAPRYRQAIVKVFYDDKVFNGDGKKALDFAYEDVKSAFQYYLKNYNNGRPFIIASHSQGSHHAITLLKEFIDTTTLKNKMVAAYVVGYVIKESYYKNIKPCDNKNQTGCYVSWMSYNNGFEPDGKFHLGSESINPVTWNSDTAIVEKSNQLGGLLLNFNKMHKNATETKLHNMKDGSRILWVNTKIPILKRFNNLHIADYNLFWLDMKQNVNDRIMAFWK